ncbi:hypothetical protein EN35_32370 [Rhodococcus qingshengii]|nr:hypothetical protein EN35_32370 [Rhodococcus qingshengii]
MALKPARSTAAFTSPLTLTTSVIGLSGACAAIASKVASTAGIGTAITMIAPLSFALCSTETRSVSASKPSARAASADSLERL